MCLSLSVVQTGGVPGCCVCVYVHCKRAPAKLLCCGFVNLITHGNGCGGTDIKERNV